MKRQDRKSHCAINFALEHFGDPWTLLIVRDIAFDGKHSFNEFLESKERIARNILSNRLKHLVEHEIIEQKPSEKDKRVLIYSLTEKGIDLVPILFALSEWSVKHDPRTLADKKFGEMYFKNPQKVLSTTQQGIREGKALFKGEEAIAKDLIS